MRKVVADMRILLEQRAHQHRIIQKRLLTRFKDKTPQPLLGLDTLLLGTHTQVSQELQPVTSLRRHWSRDLDPCSGGCDGKERHAVASLQFKAQ